MRSVSPVELSHKTASRYNLVRQADRNELETIRLSSMDYRLLPIILGAVLLLVVAFVLGTRLAEWDHQRQIEMETPRAPI